jgi:hypothetical protein
MEIGKVFGCAAATFAIDIALCRITAEICATSIGIRRAGGRRLTGREDLAFDGHCRRRAVQHFDGVRYVHDEH